MRLMRGHVLPSLGDVAAARRDFQLDLSEMRVNGSASILVMALGNIAEVLAKIHDQAVPRNCSRKRSIWSFDSRTPGSWGERFSIWRRPRRREVKSNVVLAASPSRKLYLRADGVTAGLPFQQAIPMLLDPTQPGFDLDTFQVMQREGESKLD